MIFIVGVIIATFLFFLLILKKNKEPADFIMMAWIGVIIIHLFLYYALYSGLSYKYPYTLGMILPMPLLHQVFLYFYTIELTRKTPITLKKIFIHLIPFFLLIVLAIPFYILTPEKKVEIFQNAGKGFEWYLIIQVITIILSGFAYTIASILSIKKHRKRMQEFISNTDKLMLNWLEYLTIGLGIIWLMTIFFDDQVIITAVVAFVLFIGFFGINQVPVFNTKWEMDKPNTPIVDQPEINENLNPETATLNSRYVKSGLKEEDATLIMNRLEDLMKTKKPFKDAELTLADLASQLNIQPNQLSQVINSISGKSFYHYINTWRIEEFLSLASLPENSQFTFLSIAFDCGFNAKTTFNKYFKLYTGKTPSEHFNG